MPKTSKKRPPTADPGATLAAWLEHPGASRVFGASFPLKLDCIAFAVRASGTIADIARRHGITRQAVWKQVHRVREAYGIGGGDNHPVDMR